MLPYTVEEEAVVEAEDTDAKDVDGKDERDSNFTKQQQRQRLDAVRTIVRTRPPGMPARTKRLTTPLMMVSNCFLSSSVLFQSCQSRLVVSCRVLSCLVVSCLVVSPYMILPIATLSYRPLQNVVQDSTGSDDQNFEWRLLVK
jgi:hypothetical protein